MINKNFIHDKWLSNIFQKDVYKLSFDKQFFNKINDKKSKDFEQLSEILKTPIFVYSRVPFYSNNISTFLEDLGFYLIDIDIQFEKKVFSEQKLSENSEIRFSKYDDEKDLVKISKTSFIFDRFHQDTKISNELADSIKEKWAQNFFSGTRGDFMIVALKDGDIIGFLQLIKKNDILIIDLIAVDEKFRGKNVAADMIKFAENNIKDIKKIKTGTQSSNKPSTKLYERLGFTSIDKEKVFHYHKN